MASPGPRASPSAAGGGVGGSTVPTARPHRGSSGRPRAPLPGLSLARGRSDAPLPQPRVFLSARPGAPPASRSGPPPLPLLESAAAHASHLSPAAGASSHTQPPRSSADLASDAAAPPPAARPHQSTPGSQPDQSPCPPQPIPPRVSPERRTAAD